MTNEERDELLVELRINMGHLKLNVDQLKHVLIEGNGKPAVTEQVALLVHKVAKIEETIDEEREDRKLPRAAWIGIVISIVFGLTGFVSSVM